MKKFIRIPYEEESTLTSAQLTEKLNAVMEEQKKLTLYKLKGTPLFLLEKEKEEDTYALDYHHAYKKDMCDTCLRFYIEKGLEKCRVKGFICKPVGLWALFWSVIATVLIDFLVITYCILFTADFNLLQALMISLCAMGVRAYICMSLVQFNRQRLDDIKNKMCEILEIEKEEEETEDERN